MKCALLCLILCVGAHVTADDRDFVYNREADAWLRLHIAPAAWADAGMRCYLEGGVLASPTTRAMSQAMLAMMAEAQQIQKVFTGINSILASRNFVSLEGVPLADIYLHWAPGQPDNSNSDNACLALTGKGTLADVGCHSMLPYFCRRDAKGSYKRGYKYEPRTGSYYKFHGAAKPWRLAVATCDDEGGHLAIINSATESTVLSEIYSKNPDYTITGADETRHAFIGFSKWYDEEWATLYGVTIAEAGFTGWDSAEPTVGEGKVKENCGAIHRNGLLNDAYCAQSCPFICEITPRNQFNYRTVPFDDIEGRANCTGW